MCIRDRGYSNPTCGVPPGEWQPSRQAQQVPPWPLEGRGSGEATPATWGDTTEGAPAAPADAERDPSEEHTCTARRGRAEPRPGVVCSADVHHSRRRDHARGTGNTALV
eukprot:TRINITY_DN16814_c0_g1_i1.p1 TRINITY_DN16814_c0_g1~~TRINITY_DN16814_c0_g1_i1.p1  ORF type:complete len:109 (+),score=7.47 TRINITY_DN16814_c0_g1_i1:84-410(+)